MLFGGDTLFGEYIDYIYFIRTLAHLEEEMLGLLWRDLECLRSRAYVTRLRALKNFRCIPTVWGTTLLTHIQRIQLTHIQRIQHVRHLRINIYIRSFFFQGFGQQFFSSRPQYAILGIGIVAVTSLRSSAVFGGRLKRPSPCRIRSAPGRDRIRLG